MRFLDLDLTSQKINEIIIQQQQTKEKRKWQ